MLAAVTLLPALLGFAGRRIDRLTLPPRHAAGRAPLVRALGRGRSSAGRSSPALAAASSCCVLAAARPVDAAGFPDASNQPTTTPAATPTTMLADGFGPGFNGPLCRRRARPAAARPRSRRAVARATTRRRRPSPAVPTPPDGAAALFIVYPTTAPQDAATPDARPPRCATTSSPARRQDGAGAQSAARTPASIDFSDSVVTAAAAASSRSSSACRCSCCSCSSARSRSR